MTHGFVPDTVLALVKINASVTRSGWDWIAPSLIALVSHPTSLISFALARANVSDPTSASVVMNSRDTSVIFRQEIELRVASRLHYWRRKPQQNVHSKNGMYMMLRNDINFYVIETFFRCLSPML